MSGQVTANGNYLSGAHNFGGGGAASIWYAFSLDALPPDGGFATIWSIDDNSTFVQGFVENVLGTGVTKYGFMNGSGTEDLFATALAINTWYWGCVTFSSLAGVLTASAGYFGTFASALTKITSAVPPVSNYPSTDIFLFQESANDQVLNGELAGFGTVGRTLADAEIDWLYRRMNPRVSPLSRFDLFQGGATAGTDLSGNAHNLAITGAIASSSRQPPMPIV